MPVIIRGMVRSFGSFSSSDFIFRLLYKRRVPVTGMRKVKIKTVIISQIIAPKVKPRAKTVGREYISGKLKVGSNKGCKIKDKKRAKRISILLSKVQVFNAMASTAKFFGAGVCAFYIFLLKRATGIFNCSRYLATVRRAIG